MGAGNSDKEPKAQNSGPLSFLAKLSSSGLRSSALYLIGYVIVNGYQTSISLQFQRPRIEACCDRDALRFPDFVRGLDHDLLLCGRLCDLG